MRSASAPVARYPPAIVDQIIKGKGIHHLHPHRLHVPELTLLFATSWASPPFREDAPGESPYAEPVLHLPDCIFDQRDLDKYIGDCVMAFFGAPSQRTTPTARALPIELQKRWPPGTSTRRRGEPPSSCAWDPYGGAIVGDFGSMKRLEYTALETT